GLSNYLTGNAVPPELIQKTDNPNLAFMASGPLPPNAADLLGGNRIFSLVALGSEVFDLIVVDCPPLMGLADAQLLASAVAATVFVVGAGGPQGIYPGRSPAPRPCAHCRSWRGADQVRRESR